MRLAFARALGALVCLGVLVPAAHAAASNKWGFKMFAASTYVTPLAETDRNVNGITAAVKASDELGYLLGVEFRSGTLGFAFDYQDAKHELSHATAGLLGTAELQPISASLLLHLPLPLAEISAGPTVSYVNWGELDLAGGGTEKLDAKVGVGVSLNGDFPLSSKLAVTGGMRWLKLEAKPANLDAVDVNPLITHVGLALRF